MSSGAVLDLQGRIRYKKEKALYIKAYCAADIVFCSIFFLWALYHLIFNKFFDLGVISFRMDIFIKLHLMI